MSRRRGAGACGQETYLRHPHRRDGGTSALRAGVGIVVLFTAVIAAAWWFSRRVESGPRATPYPSHGSLATTYLHDGQSVIRWYAFTDPETGAQYLVNDRGGCTPRLDADGRQMGGANG